MTTERDRSDEETVRVSDDTVPRTPSGAASASHHGRFVPGTVVAERYRIIAMLGKGGMGEVYRADDLVLGQQVALKFLPRRVASDPTRLERFLNEVRTARQIAHPNVCRVYDIAGIGGEHFISMEYVQGEDLASLLHRIGRLAPDKATQIARQLCAGLAAAHERGVLHRDLKPANIMLDERGVARITDFGLSGMAEDFAGGALVSEGTPAYMAPEQLEGREVSIRSDLYSLGLVLYELYNGTPLFRAGSLDELLRLRNTTDVDRLTLSHDVDPAVLRAIQRCLATDPRQRPASALSVAASLPGGDPLAAALAAGETPSPALVAAAGSPEGMEPRLALAVFVAALLFLGINMVVVGRGGFRLPKQSADVVAARARELAAGAGYARPADRGWRYDVDGSFWYRESPELMEVVAFFNKAPHWATFPGQLQEDEPPPLTPGMIGMRFDAAANLVRFAAVPPRFAQSPPGSPPPPDWGAFFRAANIDRKALTLAQPRTVNAGETAAWTFGAGARRQRIEAASLAGKAIYFEVMPDAPPAHWPKGRSQVFIVAVFLVLLTAILLLSRRNLRLGRGDRRGARRIAGVVFLSLMVAWLFGAHHVMAGSEVRLLLEGLAWAALIAGLAWNGYIAFEPIVRRRWPHALVGWTRLLDGRFRDPRVGRDVLIGVAAACVGNALTLVLPTTELTMLCGDAMTAMPFAFAELAASFSRVIADLILPMMLFLLLRAVLRRDLFAIIAFVTLYTVVLGRTGGPLSYAVWALFSGMLIGLLLRFGVLAYAAFNAANGVLIVLPMVWPMESWFAGATLLGVAVMVGLATWGFLTSLAGRPLFQGDLIES
ncbi:MAG TPA: serine/threonine-protein kinase [Thermoanaerobaculia bacterium]|jgi:serine/threonine-protein kinase|nr:serine/threonine-protein kinase [Thermoanaerobaculia bacterium]